MSGVRVDGGSMPLVAFCWIRYMARENCSRVSLPVCLVSASPLQRGRETGLKEEDTVFFMRNNAHCPLIRMSSDRLASGTTNHFCILCSGEDDDDLNCPPDGAINLNLKRPAVHRHGGFSII